MTALYGRFAKSLILCPNKCDMLAYRQGREPGSSHIKNQKPENRAKAETFAPYHDNCNFARMIQTPIRMVYGMADDNCQTVGGIAAYNSIASKDKELRLLPGVGHGCIRRDSTRGFSHRPVRLTDNLRKSVILRQGSILSGVMSRPKA